MKKAKEERTGIVAVVDKMRALPPDGQRKLMALLTRKERMMVGLAFELWGMQEKSRKGGIV